MGGGERERVSEGGTEGRRKKGVVRGRGRERESWDEGNETQESKAGDLPPPEREREGERGERAER